jgi:hypothetical protein
MLLEQFLSAFLERFAAAIAVLLHYVPDSPDMLQHRIELNYLLPLQLPPTGGRRRAGAKAIKEMLNLGQRKTGAPRFLDHGQAIQYGHIVTPLSVDSLRRRKNPDLFVIADGRGAKSDPARDLGNGQQRHNRIIEELLVLSPRPILSLIKNLQDFLLP